MPYCSVAQARTTACRPGPVGRTGLGMKALRAMGPRGRHVRCSRLGLDAQHHHRRAAVAPAGRAAGRAGSSARPCAASPGRRRSCLGGRPIAAARRRASPSVASITLNPARSSSIRVAAVGARWPSHRSPGRVSCRGPRKQRRDGLRVAPGAHRRLRHTACSPRPPACDGWKGLVIQARAPAALPSAFLDSCDSVVSMITGVNL
jgi:hypothetical protein